MRNKNIRQTFLLGLLALAWAETAHAELRSGYREADGRSTLNLQGRLLVGKAFSGSDEDKHGGASLGGLLTLEDRGWMGGLQAHVMGEHEECESWAWFGGCPEEDIVRVKEYAFEDFSAVSLNPLASAELLVSDHISVGVLGQAFLNARQSLGHIAFVIKFGP